MDDIAKTEMRNYAMAAGFLAIALYMLSVFFTSQRYSNDMLNIISITSTALLLMAGVILIILKNRDLTAITFLSIGIFRFVQSSAPDHESFHLVVLLSGIFIFFLLALIILTAKDKKKYLLCILPILIGLGCVSSFINPALIVVSGIVTPIVSIYFAFACASERIKLPFGALLTADVVTDFKSSGSVLGYLLISFSSIAWAAAYLLGDSVISIAVANTIDFGCGFMMIFSGVLLFAVAKMRFTPIMFIVAGFMVMLGGMVTGALGYPIGIILIILGLFAILRKESRILPAIMLILYGVTYLISANAGLVSVPIVSGILNLVVSLIAIYLAFAVFSQRKLPLF